MDNDAPIRVFVAIPVPAEQRRVLGTVIRALEAKIPPRAVRWVVPDQIHLTLRFLGDVPQTAVSELMEALGRASAGVSGFELRIEGLGCFPRADSPRVLWAGVGGDLSELERLAEGVVRETSGWGQPEGDPFSPHLTLGRVKTQRREEGRAVGEAVRRACLPRIEPWQGEAVHLMRSELSPTGAKYSELGVLRLRPPG